MIGTLASRCRQYLAANAGSAAVEFSLTVPLLVIVALGAADYGTIAVQQAALEGATRAGAEYARANPADANSTPSWNVTINQVKNFTTFSPALKPFTCASGNSCVSTVCTCVDGTSVICTTGTCSVGTPPDTRVLEYVSIMATQTFTPLFTVTNFPGPAPMSFFFPLQLNSTAVTRIQ